MPVQFQSLLRAVELPGGQWHQLTAKGSHMASLGIQKVLNKCFLNEGTSDVSSQGSRPLDQQIFTPPPNRKAWLNTANRLARRVTQLAHRPLHHPQGHMGAGLQGQSQLWPGTQLRALVQGAIPHSEA